MFEFMVALCVIFAILLIWQTIIVVIKTQHEPSGNIDKKTSIELKVLIESSYSDTDKAGIIIREFDLINWDNVYGNQIDTLVKKINSEGLLLKMSPGIKARLIKALTLDLIESDNDIVKIKLNEIKNLLDK